MIGVREEWLEQVAETVLDPERRIIDPHHHLWDGGRYGSYLLKDLWADTGSGHRVEKTVFIECRMAYRADGLAALRSVGETEWVAAVAAQSDTVGTGNAMLAGIVSHTDLRQDGLSDVLAAHVEAGQGRFRGIRHAGAHDPQPEALSIPGRAPAGLYGDSRFRAGATLLGELGWTYDTWHYHHQNRDFLALAQAVPGTTLVLDHFGTPLGVGPYAGQRAAIFAEWKRDMVEIASCPNVVAKLGGLAMPDNGFGWDRREQPATSDELVAAQGDYYRHMIDCFGPERCMFESNFPVDKRSVSYHVLWNAFKKLAAPYSESEKHALFYGTAERVYRL